jgi:hypothetical protein
MTTPPFALFVKQSNHPEQSERHHGDPVLEQACYQ